MRDARARRPARARQRRLDRARARRQRHRRGRRPDRGAQAHRAEPGRAVPVPQGEDGVVLGEPGAAVLPLLRLQGRRRRVPLRAGDGEGGLRRGGRDPEPARGHPGAGARGEARRQRRARAAARGARGRGAGVRAVARAIPAAARRRAPTSSGAAWPARRSAPSGWGSRPRAGRTWSSACAGASPTTRWCRRAGGAARERARRPLRPLPQPAHGAAGGPGRAGRRLRRARAGRGGQAQVPELARDAGVPQGLVPVRPRPGAPAGRARRGDDRGRGLLRRHRPAPGGAREHRGDLGHGAHRRPGAAAQAASCRASC